MDAYEDNQFAYSPGRSARDALLFLMLTWLMFMARGMKIALYCSDVSGAFDKVDADKLMMKLDCLAIHSDLISVFRSWLRERSAYVVVSASVVLLPKSSS